MMVVMSLKNLTWTQKNSFVRVMVKKEREGDVFNISGMFHVHAES